VFIHKLVHCKKSYLLKNFLLRQAIFVKGLQTRGSLSSFYEVFDDYFSKVEFITKITQEYFLSSWTKL
jgi:hypothetical protein